MTSNARILVSCVDPGAAQALREQLRDLGHTVCAVAPTGDEAPDLALVDLEPAGGGAEAALRLGNRLGVPVVYLVGDVDESVLREARETGPLGYVAKPVDGRQLRLTIDAALARRADRQRVSELEDHNFLLKTIVDNMPDGILVTDTNGQFLLVNRAVTQLFARGELKGSGLGRELAAYEFFEEDERTPFPEERLPLPLALHGTPSDNVHVYVHRKDDGAGSHVYASGRPLHDRRGRLTGAMVMLRNATREQKTRLALERTVEEVREQADLMRSVFDNMSDGMMVFDADGRCVLLNPKAKRPPGYPAGDTGLGEWYARVELYNPSDRSPVPKEDSPAARVVRGESLDGLHLFVRTPNGGEGHAIVHGRPLLSRDGSSRGGVIIFRDVTDDIRTGSELRNLAQRLAEQKQEMETVFASIGDGVVAANEHGEFTIYNPAAARIVGREKTDNAPSEWVSAHGIYLNDEVTPARSEDLPLSRALRGESPDDVELFVRNENVPDGVHVRVSGRPLRESGGASRGGVIVFRDVTRLKDAERKLRQAVEDLRRQNDFMEMVFASISDGVVVADAAGRLTTANPSAVRIVGMGITDTSQDEWAETYGTYLSDEVTPARSEDLPLSRALGGESSDDVGLFIRNPHVPEGVHISASGRPLRDVSGVSRGGVIVFRDVTRDVRSREAAVRAFAEGRLEVIDTVLHNIGNAISSVATGVTTLYQKSRDNELLNRFTALADKVEKHGDDWVDWLSNDPQGRQVRAFFLALVKDFRSESEAFRRTMARVSNRVEHIVDIIRTQEAFTDGTVERKLVALRPTLDDAVKALGVSFDKRGITVSVDCAAAPREIRLQESKFHQMLVNLLKNALEALDELDNLPRGVAARASEPFVRVAARAEGDLLVLDVTDNGIGIDPGLKEQIFSADYTTKLTGSGLGLHSAANYVIGAGGSIEALSEGAGHGMTMRVKLPLEPAALPAVEQG